MKKNELRNQLISIGVLLVVSALITWGLIAYQSSVNPPSIPTTDTGSTIPSPAEVSTGSLVLYKTFILAPITPDTIKRASYRVKLNGVIKTGTLVVDASVTNYGYDKTRVHSVYFYVDDGNSGGHLGAVRKNAQIIDGGFTMETSPYHKEFDLNNISLAYGVDKLRTIKLADVLNDQQPHWIGAFVDTGIYGQLDKLEIKYVCATSKCELGVVK